MAKGVARALDSLGQHPLAGEQDIGELAEEDLEAKSRSGQQGGTTQQPRQRLGELPVSAGGRRGGIHRAPDGRMLNGMEDDSHDVIDMHPGHPLLPVPHRSPEAQFEGKEHLLERPASPPPPPPLASAPPAWQTSARKSLPGPVSSVSSSSPRFP